MAILFETPQGSNIYSSMCLLSDFISSDLPTYFLKLTFLVTFQSLLRRWENLSNAATAVAATSSRAHWKSIWSAAIAILRLWTPRQQSTTRHHKVTH